MTTTNWIYANVCYFILFIVDFHAYVVDNWTCKDMLFYAAFITRAFSNFWRNGPKSIENEEI